MTAETLIKALQREIAEGRARPDSPVIVEGDLEYFNSDEDGLLQLDVEEVKGETRCEDDDEPPGLYLFVVEPEAS